MNANLAQESSAAFGRWNLALCALLAVLSAVAFFTIDPRALAQTAVPLRSLWWSFPYLVVVLLVAVGATRGAAWTSVALASLVLLGAIAAIVISEGDALALVVYLGPWLGVPLVVGALAHLMLLFSAISILRGGSGGGRFLAIILSLSLLAVVAFVFGNVRRYLASPERAEAQALREEAHAGEVMQELTYCLGIHHKRLQRYPTTLVELGPQGSKCTGAHSVSNSVKGFDIRYEPTATGYELRVLARDPARAPYDSYRSDETGAVYHSTDAQGNGGTAFDNPLEIIQAIDLCIEQYRIDHPRAGYPANLKVANDEAGCFRPFGLVSGRLLLELGTQEGRRFDYAPQPAPGGTGNSSFRLDVRPLVYGKPLKKSLLCTPEGTLHVTEEDRPAEKSDPDMQVDSTTGTTYRSYCMGPDVPARRR